MSKATSDIERLLSSLAGYHTVTISSSNPWMKTAVLSLLVDSSLSEGRQVQYFDLDLQYSAMLSSRARSSDLSSSKLQLLQLYCCGHGQVIDCAVDLLSAFTFVPPSASNASASSTSSTSIGVPTDVVSAKHGQGGLVVIDSINTLQTLLREEDSNATSQKANHEAGVLLTLLQEFAERDSKLLIISNIVRPRPRTNGGLVSWEGELSGGRLIRLKSNVIFSVSPHISSIHATDQKEGTYAVELKVDSASESLVAFLSKGDTFRLRLKAPSLSFDA